MSDNFVSNPGSGGSTFAADDLSGVLYPRVKVTFGADGSAADVSSSAPLPVAVLPSTSNGASLSSTISAASTNATSVKASAGTLLSVYASNINAAVRYLKFYNKTSSPTVGTDTPVMTVPIPGNTAGAGVVLHLPACGVAFSSGIAFAITTGYASSDTGSVAAGDVVVNLTYQ